MKKFRSGLFYFLLGSVFGLVQWFLIAFGQGLTPILNEPLLVNEIFQYGLIGLIWRFGRFNDSPLIMIPIASLLFVLLKASSKIIYFNFFHPISLKIIGIQTGMIILCFVMFYLLDRKLFKFIFFR